MLSQLAKIRITVQLHDRVTTANAKLRMVALDVRHKSLRQQISGPRCNRIGADVRLVQRGQSEVVLVEVDRPLLVQIGGRRIEDISSRHAEGHLGNVVRRVVARKVEARRVEARRVVARRVVARRVVARRVVARRVVARLWRIAVMGQVVENLA